MQEMFSFVRHMENYTLLMYHLVDLSCLNMDIYIYLSIYVSVYLIYIYIKEVRVDADHEMIGR